MQLNHRKIDEAVLAVLWLTLHDQVRVWKTVDWDAMGRLHQQGLISDPARGAKSVALTDEGLAQAHRAAEKLFT